MLSLLFVLMTDKMTPGGQTTAMQNGIICNRNYPLSQNKNLLLSKIHLAAKIGSKKGESDD